MTVASGWVERARAYLQTGHVQERNQLAADYTAGSGSLSFKYPLGGVVKGSRLSIGLNTFYVWAVGSNGSTATVSGGQEGTTDGNAAAGTTVWVRPRFTDNDLLNAVNEELVALSSPQNGLYQTKTFDITYNAAIDGYDLAGVTDLQSIYEVRFQEPGPYKDWPRIEQWQWRLDRNALLSDFPSGGALKIMRAAWPGYDIRVVYKAPFTQLASLSSDVTSTGLPSSAYDIPPLGAAIRQMAGREIKRNFTESQPDTRRATEVPPGAVFNSYRGLLLLYQERVTQECARMCALYPDLQT